MGEVDIAMYRDDRDPAQLNVEVQEKHLPVDVTGKVVVLVDDVLHTGARFAPPWTRFLTKAVPRASAWRC